MKTCSTCGYYRAGLGVCVANPPLPVVRDGKVTSYWPSIKVPQADFCALHTANGGVNEMAEARSGAEQLLNESR